MKDDNLCWECGEKMKLKNVEYVLYGVKIGVFPAKSCKKCNESYFSEETSNKITAIVKKKGLFGLEFKTKIGKTGSSLDVRIPKKLIDFMKLKKGDEVTIQPQGDDKLIISI